MRIIDEQILGHRNTTWPVGYDQSNEVKSKIKLFQVVATQEIVLLEFLVKSVLRAKRTKSTLKSLDRKSDSGLTILTKVCIVLYMPKKRSIERHNMKNETVINRMVVEESESDDERCKSLPRPVKPFG